MAQVVECLSSKHKALSSPFRKRRHALEREEGRLDTQHFPESPQV
jgi:hypothetical protein